MEKDAGFPGCEVPPNRAQGFVGSEPLAQRALSLPVKRKLPRGCRECNVKPVISVRVLEMVVSPFVTLTVIPITSATRICRYARFMYKITRSKTSGVVLKCKVCPHSEHVNEFDDRQGSRRTQAAQAMLKHASIDHGREQVGGSMSKALELWV